MDLSIQSLDTQECNRQNAKTAYSEQHKVSIRQINSKRKNIQLTSVPRRHNRPLCHICGKLLLSLRDLEHHLNIHRDVRPFSCEMCGYHCRRKYTLARHIWCQHTSRPYRCCECHRKYRTADKLLVHLRRHYDKPPPALCHICGVLLKCCKSLKDHLKFIHGPAAKQQDGICRICSKTLQRMCSVQRHEAAHDRRPYKCFECSAEYRLADRLRLHVQLHFLSTVVRPLNSLTPTSATPNFQQIFLASLSQDLKSLTGVQYPFACNQCGSMFQKLSDAQIHARSHTGVRSFCCAKCNRAFTTNSQLKDHVAYIHSNVRQFCCQICCQRFPIVRALRRHMKERHRVFTSPVSHPQVRHCVERNSEDGTKVETGCLEESASCGQGQSTTQNVSDVAPKKRSRRRSKLYSDPDWDTSGGLRCRSRNKVSDLVKRSFACDWCVKVFPTKIGLVDHIAAVHSTVRRHACCLCDRKFAVARELTRHVKTKHAGYTVEPNNEDWTVFHNGHVEEPDICRQEQSVKQEVPDTAAAKRHLKHYKVDSDRDYEVTKQQRGSRRRRRLQNKLSGFGRQTFACNRCPKVFRTKIGLGDHIVAVHSAVRRHACRLCERKFAVARELTRHIKTRHFV